MNTQQTSDPSGDPVISWPAESLAARLERCRLMLYVHEALTRKESERVRQRLVKQREQTR
jgi:hypothetical protein